MKTGARKGRKMKKNTCQVKQNSKNQIIWKVTSMWKKMLDISTLSCSRFLFLGSPFPSQSPWSCTRLPRPGASVPVLCSLLSCGLSPFTDTRDRRGVPWVVLSLQSHGKELGLLQFSVLALILLVFYPKRLQSTEVRGWGEALGLGWERRNSVCPFLLTRGNSSLCIQIPWALQGTHHSHWWCCWGGKWHHSTKAVASTKASKLCPSWVSQKLLQR